MKTGQILKTIEDFRPLYKKGDKFKIIKINKDERLMPIEGRKINNGQVFGFEIGELE